MLIINVIIGVALESEVALECQPAHSINGQQSKRKTTYSTDVHRRAFIVASLWHSSCHNAATTAAETATTTATATATSSAHPPPAFAFPFAAALECPLNVN